MVQIVLRPAVAFDRIVKFQFSGDVEFEFLSLNNENSECAIPPPPGPTSLISDCNDFISGPNAWPFVLVATTISEGVASQAAQTITINITLYPPMEQMLEFIKLLLMAMTFLAIQ